MVGWNPWHGCKKLSPGCQNCYVYRSDARYERDSSQISKNSSFGLPLKKQRNGEWKIPPGSRVWTCFTSDFLLAEADCWRDEAWDMMRQRRDLQFMFITKRIDRLQQCLPPDWGAGWPHVHIGCTFENQQMADYRLPIFRAAPVARKYLISEPLLGPLDISAYLGDWAYAMIVGGESGPNARVCDYDWVLDIRRQCIEAGVPFRFKQTGARLRRGGRLFQIPRKLQHAQAKKAGINFSPPKKLIAQ